MSCMRELEEMTVLSLLRKYITVACKVEAILARCGQGRPVTSVGEWKGKRDA